MNLINTDMKNKLNLSHQNLIKEEHKLNKINIGNMFSWFKKIIKSSTNVTSLLQKTVLNVPPLSWLWWDIIKLNLSFGLLFSGFLPHQAPFFSHVYFLTSKWVCFDQRKGMFWPTPDETILHSMARPLMPVPFCLGAYTPLIHQVFSQMQADRRKKQGRRLWRAQKLAKSLIDNLLAKYHIAMHLS